MIKSAEDKKPDGGSAVKGLRGGKIRMSEQEKALEIQRQVIKKLRDQIRSDRETIDEMKRSIGEQNEAIEMLGNIINAMIKHLKRSVVIPKEEFIGHDCEPDFTILDKNDVVTVKPKYAGEESC